MTRRLRILLSVVALLVVLGGVFLWALPELVRRQVVTRIPELTGRAVSIEDIDLNLFTGRLALKKLRLAERNPSEDFITAERVDVRVSPLQLVKSHLYVSELTLTRPEVRIIRTGAVDFNFSDILARLPAADPSKPKGTWIASIGQLALRDGAVLVSDRAVSPAREWKLQGITIQAGGLTTRAAQQPGNLAVQARLNESPFAMKADAVHLTPAALSMRVTLDRFDLTQLHPYVPTGLPASLQSGTLGLALDLRVERGEQGLTRAVAAGDVRLEQLALIQPDRPAPFVKLGRLTVAIKEADLLARAAVLKSVEIDQVDLRAVRDRNGAIDLLALAAAGRADSSAAAPASPAVVAEPSPQRGQGSAPARPFRFAVERLALTGGTIGVLDEAVSPARQWQVDGLSVEGHALANGASDPPGSLRVRAQLVAGQGAKPATLTLEADSVRLTPLAASAKVALNGFDVVSVVPYVPPGIEVSPARGSLGATLTAVVEQDQNGGLRQATASGSVQLSDLAMVTRGGSTPVLALPRLAVGIRRADAVARVLDLEAIEIEGPDVRAMRDAQGKIDLLELLTAASAPPATPTTAPPSPPARRVAVAAPPAPAKAPAAAAAWRLSLDRLALTKGKATFEDRAVTPTTTLPLTDLTVSATNVKWPATTPATFRVSVAMPGGGKTEVRGVGRLEPLDVQLRLATHDSPIDPYQAYFPFPARFSGLFSGTSVNEIQRAPDGTLILASRGSAWARDLEVRKPDGGEAVVKMPLFEIRNLDFSWPNYALVDEVRFVRPRTQIERDAEGQVNLRELFTAAEKAAAPPSAPPPASPPASASEPAKPGLLQEMVLDFALITVEDAYVRFLDRATTPAFSEDMSRLTITIRDLSNVLGRQRTTLTAEAIVGGDGALDLRGELSGIGETLRADLVGELRDFTLPSANPYAEYFTSWIVERGKLTAKVHYRIQGDRLIANHDVTFGGLKVQQAKQSDEAKRRLGLPLGLIVSLLKDSRGDIDFTLPLSGNLTDRKFDWGESMWAAAKQAVLKILAAPFNAIGRLFTGGGDTTASLEINPLTFGPGSAVIGVSMEQQTTRVADFLRRSPYVRLQLTPITTKADVENLKLLEVTKRLQQFQREQGLRDMVSTLQLYYQQRVPNVTPPKTMDDQLGLLVQREPTPTAALADLVARRLEATRDRLVKAEGIPPERLQVVTTSPDADASGEGRIEFAVREAQ